MGALGGQKHMQLFCPRSLWLQKCFTGTQEETEMKEGTEVPGRPCGGRPVPGAYSENRPPQPQALKPCSLCSSGSGREAELSGKVCAWGPVHVAWASSQCGAWFPKGGFSGVTWRRCGLSWVSLPALTQRPPQAPGEGTQTPPLGGQKACEMGRHL